MSDDDVSVNHNPKLNRSLMQYLGADSVVFSPSPISFVEELNHTKKLHYHHIGVSEVDVVEIDVLSVMTRTG